MLRVESCYRASLIAVAFWNSLILRIGLADDAIDDSACLCQLVFRCNLDPRQFP